MSRTRRTFGKDFKAKVVLEALKRRYHQVAKKVRAVANQISMWKSEAYGIFLQFFCKKRSLPKMKFQQRNSTLESVS
jgi:hypothetical protein